MGPALWLLRKFSLINGFSLILTTTFVPLKRNFGLDPFPELYRLLRKYPLAISTWVLHRYPKLACPKPSRMHPTFPLTDLPFYMYQAM